MSASLILIFVLNKPYKSIGSRGFLVILFIFTNDGLLESKHSLNSKSHNGGLAKYVYPSKSLSKKEKKKEICIMEFPFKYLWEK